MLFSVQPKRTYAQFAILLGAFMKCQFQINSIGFSEITSTRFLSSCLLVLIILIGNQTCAQDSDSIGVSEMPMLSKHYGGHYGPIPKGLQNRNEIKKTKEWQWEYLGPNATPKELNPGGKAIPAYSENRGNGTGRINYLYVHPRKKNLVWACSPTGGLWYTRDGGENWLEGGTDFLPISGVSSVAVNPKNSKQWIIATGDGDDVFKHTDGLWRTRNAGKTYKNINGGDISTALPFGQPGDFYSQISEITCHPRNFNFLVASTDRGLWICEDASRPASMKWKRVSEGHFYDVEFLTLGKKTSNTIVAAGDRLAVSYDGGSTWEQMPSPILTDKENFPFLRMSIEWSPGDPRKIYAAVTCSKAETMSSIGEASLQVFNLNTRTWEFIRTLKKEMNNMMPTRARAFAISPIDAGLIMCGNVQPLYRSEDGGLNFSKIAKNQMHDDCHHLGFWKDGKTIWVGHDGGVSTSQDAGFTWELRDNGIGAANIFGLSVAQTQDNQVLYGGYDTGCNLLKNGEWSHVNWGDGFETIIHPDNADIMFATNQNGGLCKSIDAARFEEPIGSLQTKTEWHTWIRMHPVDHNMIFCSGTKLVRSRDLGKTWESVLNVQDLGSHLFNVYRFFMSHNHVGAMYAVVLNSKEVKPEIWRTLNINEPDATKIVWEKLPDIPVKGWIPAIVIDPNDPFKCWILFSNRDKKEKVWFFDNRNYIDETRNLGFSQGESMILQKGTQQRIYLGTDYGVFTRVKGETEWTLLTGLPGADVRALDINYKTRKLVAGTYGRGVWISNLVD